MLFDVIASGKRVFYQITWFDMFFFCAFTGETGTWHFIRLRVCWEFLPKIIPFEYFTAGYASLLLNIWNDFHGNLIVHLMEKNFHRNLIIYLSIWYFHFHIVEKFSHFLQYFLNWKFIMLMTQFLELYLKCHENFFLPELFNGWLQLSIP